MHGRKWLVPLGASARTIDGISNPATLESLMMACAEALSLAEDLNISKMIVSSDCLLAINSMKVKILCMQGCSSWHHPTGDHGEATIALGTNKNRTTPIPVATSLQLPKILNVAPCTKVPALGSSRNFQKLFTMLFLTFMQKNHGHLNFQRIIFYFSMSTDSQF